MRINQEYVIEEEECEHCMLVHEFIEDVVISLINMNRKLHTLGLKNCSSKKFMEELIEFIIIISENYSIDEYSSDFKNLLTFLKQQKGN